MMHLFIPVVFLLAMTFPHVAAMESPRVMAYPDAITKALQTFSASVSVAQRALSSTMAAARRSYDIEVDRARAILLKEIERQQAVALSAGNQVQVRELSDLHQRMSASSAVGTQSRQRMSLREGTLTLCGGRAADHVDGWTANAISPLTTDQLLRAPCVVTITAKTSDMNLRLQWIMDHIIFNWEVEPGTLLVHGVIWGDHHLAEKGWIQPNVFHDIRLEATKTEVIISVDGEERGRFTGQTEGFDRNLLIYSNDSTAIVKDIVVER